MLFSFLGLGLIYISVMMTTWGNLFLMSFNVQPILSFNGQLKGTKHIEFYVVIKGCVMIWRRVGCHQGKNKQQKQCDLRVNQA